MSLGINTRITDTREQPSLFSRGKTLYVGGSGEGNYSKIQDAINDASDGDTILVYSGVYQEKIVINKQLTLMGLEETKIPIIDGCDTDYAITITTDNCIFECFHVTNTSEENWTFAGIKVASDNNILQNNTFSYNANGIWVEYSDGNMFFDNNFNWNVIGISLFNSCENTLSNNVFVNNTLGFQTYSYSDYNVFSNNSIDGNGIQLLQSSYNEITMNSITNNSNVAFQIPNALGIGLSLSYNNLINENTIANYDCIGIGIWTANNNIVTRNNILHNGFFGVYLYKFSKNNIIKQNNFFKNGFREDIPVNYFGNAFFFYCFFNQWDENYWDDWAYRIPRPIKGRFGIIGLIPGIDTTIGFIPWVNFDWHPAKEPYDI